VTQKVVLYLFNYMKNSIPLIILCSLALLFGCTENHRVKHWGGIMDINLPRNEKLVSVEWKGSSLWYLTRPMQTNEAPEIHNFVEKSNLGVAEGKVVFVESK
jgi:hypothetical protein